MTMVGLFRVIVLLGVTSTVLAQQPVAEMKVATEAKDAKEAVCSPTIEMMIDGKRVEASIEIVDEGAKTAAELYQLGVEYDEKWLLNTALFYYWRAMQQGEQKALDKVCQMADCFEVGVGVKKNTCYALALFREVAKHGYPRAWFELGRYYELGLGGAIRNGEFADVYYKRAAQMGYEPARAYIAYLQHAAPAPISYTSNEDDEPTGIPSSTNTSP